MLMTWYLILVKNNKMKIINNYFDHLLKIWVYEFCIQRIDSMQTFATNRNLLIDNFDQILKLLKTWRLLSSIKYK